MTLLTIPALSAVALGLLAVLVGRAVSQGRDIPGPWLARYTRLWYIWQMVKGDFQYTNIKLHRRFGKVVRIAPGWYSLNDVDALKAIYAHGSQFTKSEWYEAWNFSPSPDDHNLFSVRNPTHHSDARRKVASMYSMSAMVSYEPYVNDCIRRFFVQLDSLSNTSSTMDLGHWLQCFAFDTISDITYGERFGFLDQGEDINNLMANLEESFVISSLMGLMLWLRPVVLFLGNFFAKSDTLFVRRFTDQKFTELSKKDNQEPAVGEPLSMVQRFLQARDEGKGLTDRYIQVSAASNIGAGSDTTGIGLSAVVFYLYRSPEKLETLRKELNDACPGSEISFPEAQKLPYLQAVIKESMRLHPGVGFPLFRVVPRGGAVICDKFFPEGTNVGINSWVMHRDESIWGANADDFVPERWLLKDAEKLRLMEQCLMPFGLGSRVCVGKNISLFEINKLIPSLVRSYDIEIQEQEGKDMRARNMWFVKPVRFQVTIKKSSQSVP
ncbi:cytochrome P450 [Aspergillus ibericus CBS 121593]|uniref:Cytochrome P450 n=1 Tax=Aspergillus ibericus CBS 121593 TaxID=1448316 RepID=A0A395H6C2_9EURO|nr:cytochrome P450 [Aspergillus ibericus CBS 121593]RAL03462.1 cytochrome P450 [Aspergillus ibericus CBS 121593]